jgi:hypothetical protein
MGSACRVETPMSEAKAKAIPKDDENRPTDFIVMLLVFLSVIKESWV